MRILVLHTICYDDPRRTIDDHAYSFGRYKTDDFDLFYCDVIFNLPLFLRWFHWDGIIIHYSLAGFRTAKEEWKLIFQQLKRIRNIPACKVLIPQDEYTDTSELWKMINECGIDTVFTCAYQSDFNTLYPKEKVKLKHLFTTLTGFIDEECLKTIKRLSKEVPERDIDIGYRARKLPYWVGIHGQLKTRIAEEVMNAPSNVSLKMDISLQPQDVFHGDDWYRFLLRCRTILGCLGGSSMIDDSGQIRLKVNEYVRQFPNASFQEVEKACFFDLDNSISVFAISPRHFECAMTRTCQLLVEGDYFGIFQPGKHYIEIKKDFSNLSEVLDKVRDKEYCKKIAENAYRDIVESGKYTYREFAHTVLTHIQKQVESTQKTSYSIGNYFLKSLFALRLKSWPLRLFLANIWLRVLRRLKVT